ncbi:MAG TPA: hypothetical protein VE986_07485 [Hyphomicrobiales bacterium]|nr:hypothetical protein [Hyphomicrobiales bacterium]
MLQAERAWHNCEKLSFRLARLLDAPKKVRFPELTGAARNWTLSKAAGPWCVHSSPKFARVEEDMREPPVSILLRFVYLNAISDLEFLCGYE